MFFLRFSSAPPSFAASMFVLSDAAFLFALLLNSSRVISPSASFCWSVLNSFVALDAASAPVGPTFAAAMVRLFISSRAFCTPEEMSSTVVP